MTSIQLKLKVVVGVCNYVIFLANVELARSFSKISVWNHQTFKNSCAKSSNVCVRNHQDNYFLINVACRSDANLIKWPCVSYCRQFRRSSKFIHSVL